ncbi:unnamed protein product [Dracunculus medinensis]|uniref:Transposase n=1 Tax=Dracunculus medinensis TaxID=318479 RepID=A0A0N4U8T4_DRAME|nr:unnamed protein product [Dracunculus medinensis]
MRKLLWFSPSRDLLHQRYDSQELAVLIGVRAIQFVIKQMELENNDGSVSERVTKTTNSIKKGYLRYFIF